jgi:hypothetical protein
LLSIGSGANRETQTERGWPRSVCYSSKASTA